MRVIVALVAGLLAVSCTGAEPEENTPSGGPPIERVRFLRPVEEIEVNHHDCGYIGMSGAGCIDWGLIEGRAEARSLVAELRQDRPAWLRYVRGVQVRENPIDSGFPRLQAQVHTGIAFNRPGVEVARTICQSVLGRGMKQVQVWGFWSSGERDSVGLAKCS